MAYSNWGAFVYKDKVRRPDKEDVGVFDTDEANLPSGWRVWANIYRTRAFQGDEDKMTPEERLASWARCSHHAVLGDGNVRFCGYKDSPELWSIGDDGVLLQHELPKPTYDKGEYELSNQAGTIEVDGQTWEWYFNQFNGNMVDLRLKEPDDSIWTSRCGYGYGAGWMDDAAGDDSKLDTFMAVLGKEK